MAAMNNPDDWPVGDDELSLGQPEDENAEYYVDWIEDAIFQDGSDGKRWYYTVKWSGWKRNANTKEPLTSFVSKEMPNKFWSSLGLSFQPKKKQGIKDHYVTPSAQLAEWMAIARATRENRIKTAQAKNAGKKPKNIPAPVPGSDSSSSAASSSDESDAPLAKSKPAPKPRPRTVSPPPKKKAAGADKGKGRASEVTQKKKKPMSSDDDSEDERPKKKKANVSSTQARPKPTEPLQPRKRPLSESASPPPVSKRPAPRPNVNASSNNNNGGEMTSRERAEMFQEKERERKRKEKEAAEAKRIGLDANGAGGVGGGEVKKVVKKQHDWGLGARVASGSGSGSGGDVKPNLNLGGGLNGGGGFEDPYNKPSSSSSSYPTTSTSSIPKKARTTITLLLGPPKLKPTLASLAEDVNKAQQTLGLADLTDLTDPLPVVSLPGGGGGKVRTIANLMGNEPEVCLEQTWSLGQAAVVFRGVKEASMGGGVVQFCRVEAGVKGEAAERGEREKAFRQMAWWLEESCEGGSISVAYLPQSPYAFVVLPRSSPLCVELNVPSSLRDACRPYKESLIGALVILPKPTLPMPAKINDLSLDFSLDRWGLTLPFINSLRQASTSVAIFAPTTTSFSSDEPLPGIALLYDLLTSPADYNGPNLLYQPTKVVAVPGPDADQNEVRRFTPEVVLVHNAKQLWMLPNLVELRRRTGTRFFAFGTGKETYVPEQKTTFFEFGIARKAQITLTPSVLIDDPALVKKGLISLLKTGSLDYQLNLHPSTVVYVDAVCNQDEAPFKNLTLSALIFGCRTGTSTGPFVVAGTEPLHPTHDPELLDRNVDLDTDLQEATTFADLLKACKDYCVKEGSLDAAGGGSVDLERAEADALGMIRSNLRNTSLINRYRRFIVAGPTKSSSEDVEGLKLGAENMSLQDLLTELKGRYP